MPDGINTILEWFSNLAPARGTPIIYIGVAILLVGITSTGLLIVFGVPSLFARGRSFPARIGDALGGLLIEALILLCLGLIWIGYSTPPTLLPLVSPPAGSFDLLPVATAIYDCVAVTLHAALIAAAAFVLYVLAIGLLATRQSADTLSQRRLQVVVFAGSPLLIALLVGATEVAGWPIWFVVPLELAAAYVAIRIATALISQVSPFSSPLMRYRWSVIQYVLDGVLTLTLFALIVAWHDVHLWIVSVVGLFITLVQIDAVVSALAAFVRPRIVSNHTLLSPRRWIVTVPLTLVFAAAGASGWFNSLVANTDLTYALWLEVGGAAIAYMVFRPLTDLAYYSAGIRADETDRLEDLTGFLNTLGGFVSRTIGSAPTQSSPAQAGTTVATPSGEEAGAAHVPLRALSRRVNYEERQTAQQLVFHTGVVFLAAMLLYHFVTTHANVESLVSGGSNQVSIILGVIALVAGLLPIFSVRVLEAPRNISLVLLFFVGVVIAINVAFQLAAVHPQALDLTGRTASDLLLDSRFEEQTALALAQELVFVFAAGQLAYLYRLLDGTITLEQRGLELESRLGLAAQYYNLDKFDLALAAYDRALALDPKAVLAWEGKADSLLFLNRYDEALAAYTRAVEFDPERAGLRTEQAETLLDLNRCDEALKVFEASLALDDKVERTWAGKGRCLKRLHRDEEAVNAYSRAVDLDSGQWHTWNGVARLMRQIRRGNDAEQASRRALDLSTQALRLNPRDALAWSGKGQALLSLHDDAGALDAFERALAIIPGYDYALEDKGRALYNLHRYDEALAAYESALRLNAHLVDAYEGKAAVLLRLGRNEEAATAYQRALDHDARDTDAWIGRGEALLALRRLDEALSAGEAALALDADLPGALVLKGRVLERQGNVQAAREAYTHALDYDPLDAAEWRGRGFALAGLGQAQEAIDAYDRSLSQDDAEPATYQAKAAALRMLGRDAEALAVDQRARELVAAMSGGSRTPVGVG
jgi:tetratricopeptide (TPR) repeat protein